jgi:alpha-mannosidase
LLVAAGAGERRSFASVESPDLVIDTIKKAQDEDALIVRLYECHGARGVTSLRLETPVKSARFCNLLEDDGPVAKVRGGRIEIPYRPFEIISLKVR